MVIDYQHRQCKTEKLKNVGRINGQNILIYTSGDRDSILKYKNVICSVITKGAEQYFIIEEDLPEEDAQVTRICFNKIDKVEILEWEEREELEEFYIVVKLITGNELHINKAVA